MGRVAPEPAARRSPPRRVDIVGHVVLIVLFARKYRPPRRHASGAVGKGAGELTDVVQRRTRRRHPAVHVVTAGEPRRYDLPSAASITPDVQYRRADVGHLVVDVR